MRAAWGSLLISVGINRKIERQEYKSIIVCLWGVCGVERLLRAKEKTDLTAGGWAAGFKAEQMPNLMASLVWLIETAADVVVGGRI